MKMITRCICSVSHNTDRQLFKLRALRNIKVYSPFDLFEKHFSKLSLQVSFSRQTSRYDRYTFQNVRVLKYKQKQVNLLLLY